METVLSQIILKIDNKLNMNNAVEVSDSNKLSLINNVLFEKDFRENSYAFRINDENKLFVLLEFLNSTGAATTTTAEEDNNLREQLSAYAKNNFEEVLSSRIEATRLNTSYRLFGKNLNVQKVQMLDKYLMLRKLKLI